MAFDSEVRIDLRADSSKLPGDLAKGAKELERLKASFDKQTESIKKQSAAIEDMKRKLAAITLGEKATASLTAMETQLRRITAEIKAQEAEQAKLVAQYEQARVAQQAAISMGDPATMAAAAAEVERLDNALMQSGEQLDNLWTKSDSLASKISEIKLDPASSAEAQTLRDRIALAEEKLDSTKASANELSDTLRSAFQADTKPIEEGTRRVGREAETTSTKFRKIFDVIKRLGVSIGSMSMRAFRALNRIGIGALTAGRQATRASNGFERLAQRIGRLVTAAFVFNVVRRAMSSLRDYMGKLLQSNKQFMASWNAVNVNLLTAFAPIWETIQPALVSFMNVLAKATQILATFVALLFGKTYAQARSSAEAMNDQAKAIDGVGGSAKKATKQLFAFDEINQQIEEDAGGAAGAGLDFSQALEDMELSDFLKKLADLIKAGDWYGVGKAIAEKIAEILSNLDWDEIKQRARDIAEAIANFINGFIDTPEFWYQIGHTLAEAINTAFEFVKKFAETIKWHELGQMLAYGLNTAIAFWDPQLAGEAIYKLINGIVDTMLTFFRETNWLEFGRKVGEFFNTLFDGIDARQIGQMFAAKLNAAIKFLLGLLKTVDWVTVGLKISEFVNGWVSELDSAEIADLINSAIKAAVDLLLTLLTEIDWYALGQKIGDLIKGIDWVKALEGLDSIISAALKGVISLVAGTLDIPQEDVDKLFSQIEMKGAEVLGSVGLEAKPSLLLGIAYASSGAEGLTKIFEEQFRQITKISVDIIDNTNRTHEAIKIGWGGIAEWFSTNVIQPIGNFFKGLWESVSGFFKSLLNDIQGIWNTVADWFKNTVIEPIKNFFKEFWTSISGFFKSLWSDIQGIWSVVSAWFNTNVIQPISGFFKGLWDGVKGFFEGLWKDIQDVWGKVSDWFEKNVTKPISDFFTGAINVVIDAINGMIRGLNSIKIDLPDWLGEFLGMGRGATFGFNIREIQRLATGGVVDHGIYELGENGKEAVVPLENNTGWINAVAMQMADAIDNFSISPSIMNSLAETGARQGSNGLDDSSIAKLLNGIGEQIATIMTGAQVGTVNDGQQKGGDIYLDGRKVGEVLYDGFSDVAKGRGVPFVLA